MSSNNKIYRYPSSLQLLFPEGLEEIRFLRELAGFNYLSVINAKKIELPKEFEEIELPKELLEELRQKKYGEAELLRKQLQFVPITYQNASFSASLMARQNMIGVVAILSNSADKSNHYWRDENDKAYEFALGDFSNMLKIISARDTELYSTETQIRELVRNETNLSALENLKVSDLWK